MLGLGGAGGRVLHGEYTIDQGGGTYKTIVVRTGQVSAVSASSITVTSADKSTGTFTVQPSTIVDSQAGGIGSVAKGDTVNVQAVVQGQTQTATNIVDVTKIGNSRRGFGLVPPGAAGGAGAARRGPLAPATAQA